MAARPSSPPVREREAEKAFSLIEIMVVIALLTVIILGLVAMFNQTQRAFVSTMTQVDVLGSGRSAADLIGREVEQMVPSGAGIVTNFYVSTPNNIFLTQALTADPSQPESRTNILQELFFVTRYNQQWQAIGYRLTNYQNGIGTLFRYSTTNITTSNALQLATQVPFFLNTTTNPVVPTYFFTRLIDGVVDFRIRVYDTNGNLFPNRNSTPSNSFFQTWQNQSGTVFVRTNAIGDYALCAFSSNQIPAYVEIELGVLEDRTLARYQALLAAQPTPPSIQASAAWAYLTNHAGQVHIFRQRIPVRSVNPSAF